MALIPPSTSLGLGGDDEGESLERRVSGGEAPAVCVLLPLLCFQNVSLAHIGCALMDVCISDF